ncbi:hypothetical protein RGQ29_024528 [Quercus rubra]|uniref:Uncharacterized protein n=1 Tax=Quercus rubra TaxID=3512 RepID=A0AAN7EVS3_QUERU|nr:hypothetical protein RGQ29_024528 [Quercus rubra]
MDGISRREAGETSGGITEDPELEARLKIVEDAKEKVKPSPTPKIQKVIFLRRDHKDFQKHYEPRAVSLGPIHHRNDKYQLGKNYKLALTNEFVKGNKERISYLYKMIGEKINELKDCFEKGVIEDYDDASLIWMLLVDGCAILQYIDCAVNNKFEKMNIKPDSIAFTQQDFWSENERQLKESIERYINRLVTVPPLPEAENQSAIFRNTCPSSLSWSFSQRRKQQRAEKEKEQSHQSKEKQQEDHSSIFRPACLSSLSRCLSQRLKRQQAVSKKSYQPKEKQQEQRILIDGDVDPIHLLDLLRTSLLDKHKKTKGEKPNWETWQSYRNVQELRAAGIHVERSKKENCRLSDISFTTLGCLGYLWLPPITVDDSTMPKFLNLIAYEMCLDFQNDFGITSYIYFLDSLIDEANDVKLLRKAGILYNCLGSDEEVAQVFNEIGNDLVPNSEIYRDIRLEIQKHYKNQFMTWLAEFCHDHFSSPWMFLAFVGALLALMLTIMQTKYTVNPPPGPCDKFCKNFT